MEIFDTSAFVLIAGSLLGADDAVLASADAKDKAKAACNSASSIMNTGDSECSESKVWW